MAFDFDVKFLKILKIVQDEYLLLCKKIEHLREFARIDLDLLDLSVNLKNVPDAKEELDKVHVLVQTLMNEKEGTPIVDKFDEVLQEEKYIDSALGYDNAYSKSNSGSSQSRTMTAKTLDLLLSELTQSFTEQEILDAYGRFLHQTLSKSHAPQSIEYCVTLNSHQDLTYTNKLTADALHSQDSQELQNANDEIGWAIVSTQTTEQMSGNGSGDIEEEAQDQITDVSESNNTEITTVSNDYNPKEEKSVAAVIENETVQTSWMKHPDQDVMTNVRDATITQDTMKKDSRFTGSTEQISVTDDTMDHSLLQQIRKDLLKSTKSVSKYTQSTECDRCGKILMDSKSLNSHQRYHRLKDQNVVIKCRVCGKGFLRRFELNRHEKTHSTMKRKTFVCDICGKTFTTLKYCKLHKKNHSKTPTKQKEKKEKKESSQVIKYANEPFKCQVCEKEYSKNHQLQKHIRIHHSNEKPFLCNICGKSFPLKGYLSRHMTIHSDSGFTECTVCHKLFTCFYMKKHMRIHTGEKPYKCSFCGMAFRKSDSKNAHERSHTGNYPHECETCGKKFNFKVELRLHHKRCMKKIPFLCSFCGQDFESRCLLSLHRGSCLDYITYKSAQAVEKKTVFKCSDCEKECQGAWSLALHMVNHPSDLQNCMLCDQTFDSFQDLQTHVRDIHLRKKFECAKCEKFFSSAQSLKSHMSFKHDIGVPNYQCETCGKVFKAYTNCHRHKLVHLNIKPWKCTVCGNDFRQKVHLDNHMWSHRTEKKYNCNFCDRGYNEKRAFLSHSKIHQVESVESVNDP